MGMRAQGYGETQADLRTVPVKQTGLFLSDQVEGCAEEERKIDFGARFR